MREENVSILTSTIFASISLVDFKTILDIVLIVLSIINIMIVILIKFIRYTKDKNLDDNEKADLKNDFKKLNEKFEEGVKNGRR